LQLMSSPSCTLISCIQVPNHTSTYTCSTLSLHGILITYTCSLTHLHRVYIHQVHNHPHLTQPLHIPHTPFTQVSGIALQRINNHWISRDLAFRRITFPSVIVIFSVVPLLSSCFEHNLSYSLVKCLAECDSCFVIVCSSRGCLCFI